MPYLVIEMFPGIENAYICKDKDGKNLVFDTYEEAKKFVAEECQIGTVVKVENEDIIW